MDQARDQGKRNNPEEVMGRLRKSTFRARFTLKKEDRDYIDLKGWDTIRSHAEDLLRKRIAPADIANDGRQTPWKGHPVFVAQHATGICCRKCLANWHGIPRGRALTEEEIGYLVDLLVYWLRLNHEV